MYYISLTEKIRKTKGADKALSHYERLIDSFEAYQNLELRIFWKSHADKRNYMQQISLKKKRSLSLISFSNYKLTLDDEYDMSGVNALLTYAPLSSHGSSTQSSTYVTSFLCFTKAGPHSSVGDVNSLNFYNKLAI